jgi:type VI secretion system protein ImpH
VNAPLGAGFGLPAEPREAGDGLAAVWDQVGTAPWRHDFCATLRRIDALDGAAYRLGTSPRPGMEPIRLAQDVELDMAPAALSSFVRRRDGVPQLGVRFFGLFGPMGPLPLHLTEFVRDRIRHHGDASPARFADLFHHRALLLFWRAWALAQPAVHLDRNEADAFSRWVGAFIGECGPDASADRPLPWAARLFHAPTLAHGPRHAEGLSKLLRERLDVPVAIEGHVGHWLELPREDRTALLPASAPRRLSALGAGAVAGRRTWDRQSKFRVVLGPLTWPVYQRYLPGREARRVLRDWVRDFVGMAFAWELQLCLRGAEVPRLALPCRAAQGRPLVRANDASGRLGWSTWARPGPSRGGHPDRRDLRTHPERHDLRAPPGRGLARPARLGAEMTLVDIGRRGACLR